jgi:hypothetical protein
MTAATISRSNPLVAEWLDSHGATNKELVDLPLDRIDDRRSLRNQARFQSLDERLVVTYSEAMAGNAQFPPIVVVDDGSSGVLVIDGNHRIASARLAGKTSLPAYVLRDVTERQIHVLTFDANTKHGMPTSAEERKAHAIYLVDTAGVGQKDAALMLNIPLRELAYELNIQRANKRLASFGLERWEELPRSARARLDNVSNDKVLRSLADLAIKAKLGPTPISDLVTEINKQTTEDAGLAVVDAARAANESRMRMTVGGRSKIPMPLMRLNRSLAYARAVEAEEIDAEALDSDTKTILRSQIADAQAKLEAILGRLG